MIMNFREVFAVDYIIEKRRYFNNLDLNKITDNKVSWKTVKPFRSDKCINTTRISLINDNKIIIEDTKVANTLNMYFETAVNSIYITENKYFSKQTGNLEDPI